MHNSRIKGDVCTEEKKEKLKAQKLNKKKRKRRNSESRPHSKQQLKNGTADNRPWDIIDFDTHQNQPHHLLCVTPTNYSQVREPPSNPHLILQSQTINTNIINYSAPINSDANFLHYWFSKSCCMGFYHTDLFLWLYHRYLLFWLCVGDIDNSSNQYSK